MPNISVDMDACQSHGQCEFAAEAIFQLDDDGEH
jgi:ferredoxin